MTERDSGETAGPAPAGRGAAHAHVAMVCTVVWHRDSLAARGRWEAAERLRLLSARLARSAPQCPVTGAAIEALRESVSELAKSEPDSNRLVTLLRQATDAAGHVPGAAEQVKRIIANAARSEPPPGKPGDPGRPDG